MDGWMDGRMDGWKSGFKDCLQQSKNKNMSHFGNFYLSQVTA